MQKEYKVNRDALYKDQANLILITIIAMSKKFGHQLEVLAKIISNITIQLTQPWCAQI